MNSNLYSGNLAFKKPYDNDTSEENYVSPQDISIKDEQVWDPSDEEIIAYAAKLGYDIEKDPDELFEVAYYYMKYPLPEGWKRGIMKTSKELVYINLVDGEIEISTEIEEMAHQMYLEKKAEMNQKNIFKKSPEKEKTTVVPRKKIPPLNPLQKSNNSNGIRGSLPSIKDPNSNKKKNINNNTNIIEKNDYLINNQNILEKNKEDILKLNNNIDKFLEKSLSERAFKELTNSKDKELIKEKEKEQEKSKEKSKENNLIKDNFKIIKNQEKNLNIEVDEDDKKKNYFLDNDNEEEEEEMEEDEDDILDKKSSKEDDFLEKMLKKDKELEALRKQKEKDIELVLNNNENIKNLVGKEFLNSEENLKKTRELEKEKKNYLQKKLEELKEYKNTVKINYKEKKDKKDKYIKEQKNKYEKKLKEEINNKKEKLKKQYEEKLELYEQQLINKKNKEEKRYKEELINIKNSRKEENIELIKKKREKEKENLKNKKEELLKEIEKLKKIKNSNEATMSQKKFNLQKNIMLIDEKKNLDKNNKLKKNELDIKNIEYQKEKEFNEVKNKLIEKYNKEKNNIKISNYTTKEENLEMALFNDIQKAMDEEFEINKKEIEQELKNKKLKEIEKYTSNINTEKNDKINLFKTEILSTEKDYYKSISDIRTNSQKLKFNNENNLKLKFEETLNKYENTKKAILDEYKELTKHISDNLQKLIVGNYTLKQTERKLEEFLINLKDNYMLIYQKNKNNFDMYENDYIFKTQFIKYLLDVVNYMTKLFSNMKTLINDGNNSVDDNKKSQIELAENLLKFCNNKIYEYSKKYNKNKNISVFSFMNGNVMKSQSFDNSKINEFDDINETLKFEASHRGNKKYKTTNDKNTTNNNIFSKEIINETLNNTSNNEPNELTFLNLDQENNISIPIIPEKVISNINKDISDLYSNITNFLKDEYNKIIQINKLSDKNKVSTNLNLIILDKIKSFCEESFNYLLANHKNNEQQLNIKKKLRLILNNIDEYKNQFNLDKYLQKSRMKNDMKIDLSNSRKNYYDNQMYYKTTLKNTYSFNNYINKNNDITNFAKTTYKTNKIEKNEIEEQKQSSSIEDVNLSKSFNNNTNYNPHINGRFNNFFRQYSSNTLAEEISNPILYKFFNYKKNKYELDKSLGKFSMP